MKKMVYIVVPALIVLALAIILGTTWLLSGDMPETTPQDTQAEQKLLTVYDARGNVLLTANSSSGIYDTEYWAYLELVLTEAAEVLAEEKGCGLTEAQGKLLTEGYQVHTYFDGTAFEALKAVESRWGNTCSTAAAITDLNGGLLAVACTDTEEEQTNYALERRSPYSSFKALSVYTPAIEKSIVTWATLYEDSPYKQLKLEDGTRQDWPANASGTYSNEKLTVYEALRTSLNTVAVKCLEDVGVTNSISFLQDTFGIPLKQEAYVAQHYGVEEVIGNIALGYLETGITPVEMAGYYQVFANGGLYAAPKTVKAIHEEDGTALYTRQITQEQAISAAAADTMNKLLQGVVKAGGTGEAAICHDVEIAGKTGTGDAYADNWFVGVTPGYSLAVWHGQHDSNQAEEMFAAVVQRLYSNQPNANRKFITHKNLYQIAYCVHSGKAVSSKCTTIDVGYFASNDALDPCDACGKN